MRPKARRPRSRLKEVPEATKATDRPGQKQDVGELAKTLAEALRFVAPRGSDGVADDDAAVAAARTEALELLDTLRQMRGRLDSLKRVASSSLLHGPLASACVPNNETDSSQDVSSYVAMKAQMMLSYVIGLTYYLLLKSEGIPVRNHPVVHKLLWVRTLLEKLRPVDQRLQYQIGKLREWADGERNATAADDPASLRPGELTTGVHDEDDEGAETMQAQDEYEDGVYKAPKIAQMEYTGDHITVKERAEKDLERTRSRLERSEFVRSLREEFTDTPAEVAEEQRSARAERAVRQIAERTRFEEDYMMRMRLSKKEAMAEKRALKERQTKSGGAVSLNDATVDLGEIAAGLRRSRGRGKGRGKTSRGSALQDFQRATHNARESRRVADSALDGSALKGGRGVTRKAKGGGKNGGKRRKK
mmetsp:Transcript_81152/g.160886  ORF Transcript_81152/g.160886 Transcript_81152/m.160886 type:complete len:419 (+) Transcript_81152:61-1317(+)